MSTKADAIRPNGACNSSEASSGNARFPRGQVVIRSDWSQCMLVRELLVYSATLCGFDDFSMRRAIWEALRNAMKHGNGCDPDKCIDVEYGFDGDRFLVSIADEGMGFQTALSGDGTCQSGSGTGRGLSLMRHYMTEVRFNQRGNRVEMLKHRACAVAAVGSRG